MGFYARYVFPRLMDWSLSRPQLAAQRRAALAGAAGEVLEIGFGTGLNLPFYPAAVRRIRAVDANAATWRLAQPRLAATSIAVEHQVLDGARLPWPDNAFDSVVSTFTLCSIARVDEALAEVRRVLKPGGRFFFLEHGLSRDLTVARWQRRLTPLVRLIGQGCHLDRPIRRLVEAHLAVDQCDEHYVPGLMRVGGYFYRGTGLKS